MVSRIYFLGINTCSRHLLSVTIEMATCGDLHGTPNPCAWIQSHCLEEDPWMAAYLSFIYCRLGRLDPVALAVLLAWLAMVFCVFGRIASRFLCPNLSSISTFLRMPQSMAGVTLAALGSLFAVLSLNVCCLKPTLIIKAMARRISSQLLHLLKRMHFRWPWVNY